MTKKKNISITNNPTTRIGDSTGSKRCLSRTSSNKPRVLQMWSQVLIWFKTAVVPEPIHNSNAYHLPAPVSLCIPVPEPIHNSDAHHHQTLLTNSR